MRSPTNRLRVASLKKPRISHGLRVAVTGGLIAVGSASAGLTCGYDSPQLVSRGFLNWIYPDSLYVIGAISREVAAGRLPLANFDQIGADLFGRRLRATKMALEQFGEMLRVASPAPSQRSVSLVLVEPMLWTRFDQGPHGPRTTVHASGAQPGDLVLVTGEAVIGEIVTRRLTFGQAVERGVVRLYGSAPQIAQFLLSYEEVGAADSGVDVQLQPDAPPVTASAGQFASKQSHPAGIAPAEIECMPNHPRISFYQGGNHDQ